MSAVLPSATVDPKPVRRDVPTGPPPSSPSLDKVARSAEKLLSPDERLAITRSKLRGAMMEIAHPPQRPAIFGTNFSTSATRVFEQLMAKARALPGASIVIESLENWWRDHPLHTAGVVAGEASRNLMRPVVERRPQAFVLGAAAVGALLVLSRPWRWLLRPALFIGLMPQLLAAVVKRVPTDAWMRVALATLGAKKSKRHAGKDARSSMDRPAAEPSLRPAS